MPTAHMLRPLLDHLEKHCEKHSPECPLGSTLQAAESHSSRVTLDLVADDDGRPRHVVRDVRCQQCTFVLMLQSIQRNVSSKRVQDWLNEPLFDLKGKTPRACLDDGNVEPVINALWLLDQTELTCG
ncbi:MAG: hypothetical protein WCL32_21880 [Planctomycetota bacterium]